jgi:predicted permease
MIGGLIARGRSLWRGLRRGPALQAEMDEEFRLHMELRAADLVRAGLAPAEAARRARLEFGSTERYKEEGRRSRGLHRFDQLHVSWLDFKLGFRMLGRYPGLTLVGGFAMAFAIWAGAGAYEFVHQVVSPTLPLAEGDRVVGLQNWDAAESRTDRQALHDFATWRRELRSVRDLGAFRIADRNLITRGGDAEPIEVAEISAAAFRVARVAPLLGRTLADADERPGATPVVVVGHDVWQRRFAGAPDVVGRTVRLGSTQRTVVGVMPAGYAFPISQSVWVPLRLDELEHSRGEGPDIRIFGRLAPGATLEAAQAELAALGRRAAADFPRTNEHLRPQVMPYAQSILSLSGTEALLVRSTNIFLVMFLVLVCGNVALLMFARAATRESEIVVRSALGASRGRIVAQLFAEALVLGGVATAIGLAATGFGMRWAMRVVMVELQNGARLPFWFTPSVSPETVLYAVVLTVLGAIISGVMPALKVTGGLQARLREAGAGGGGLRFGGIWTAVIVSQVAVTVAFPMTAFFVHRDAVQIRAIAADFPAAEYLSVQLRMDRETAEGAPADTSRAAFLARFRVTTEELERRLAAEPGVAGVTFADRLPRMYHPARLADLDEGGAAPLHRDYPAYRVSSASVDADYFDVLQAPILRGRSFHSGDAIAGDSVAGTPRARGGVVIVNQSFVNLVLGGRNPIGRRVRFRHFEESEAEWSDGAEAGPWHEIVGVVQDMGMAAGTDPKVAGIYHPLAPDATYPLHMAVHVRGDPAAFTPRLRAVAFAVDPTLQLDRIVPMHELSDGELQFLGFWFRITVFVSAIAVMLSLAGIYAVMSFTVSRRTREIGIRVALGADRRRVALTIFRRPLTQVAFGVLAGGVLMALLMIAASGFAVRPKAMALLALYAAFMMLVCMLACIVPTRRALRIEPTEALRGDG